MLPLSIRRVVSSAVRSPAAAATAFVASRSRARLPLPAKVNLTTYGICGLRQCRPSSSNGSSPGKGVKDCEKDEGKSVASKPADRKSARRNSRRSRRYESAEPIVPSYHDLTPDKEQSLQVALASFWSMHRPISLDQPIPKSVTDEEFASIFEPGKAEPYLDHLVGIPPIKQMRIYPDEIYVDGHPARRVHVQFDTDQTTDIVVATDAAAPQFLIPAAQSTEAPDSIGLANALDRYGILDPESLKSFPLPETQYISCVIKVQDSVEADDSLTPVDGERAPRGIRTLSVVRIRKLKMNKKKFKKLQKKLKLDKRKSGQK